VVELRDELRERAERAHRKATAPGCDLRRRYSDEEIARALELIAEGRTLKEAAFAVGAPRDRVACWVRRAGQPRPGGRRRYSQTEIAHALSRVQAGASLRQAGAAVGATGPTVLKWLRKAA
jgi:transposase-like protein